MQLGILPGVTLSVQEIDWAESEFNHDLEKLAEIKDNRLRNRLIRMAIGDHLVRWREGRPDNRETWSMSEAKRNSMLRSCYQKGWIDDWTI